MKPHIRRISMLAGLAVAAFACNSALAYDGTNCKAPGNCWEPKPGYPAKVAGSKYDPKHSAEEVAKQQTSINEMEARNRQRVEHFKRTGTFIYDVRRIPAS